jgi:transcription initiation factor IIE alpha subunit
MHPRSNTHSTYSQGASARRRIRRTTSGHRLYCNTNGCTTVMQADANGYTATCPICGARRAIH